jgi:hypothetical protein
LINILEAKGFIIFLINLLECQITMMEKMTFFLHLLDYIHL